MPYVIIVNGVVKMKPNAGVNCCTTTVTFNGFHILLPQTYITIQPALEQII